MSELENLESNLESNLEPKSQNTEEVEAVVTTEPERALFTSFGLDGCVLEALDSMRFTHATPIQSFAIPLILKNRDMIACAQTGTGKTAAFILPILNKLVGKQDMSINTLVLVPTRELAIQIEKEIQGLSYFVSVGSIAIYGGGDGKNWTEQKDALVEGRDIIVATPGKLLSHLQLGYMDLSNLKHLVLDEADKMLDMGFTDDIDRIISFLPKERQTLLFSATMPPKIEQLASKILQDPERIALSISKPAAGVKQFVSFVHPIQKIPMLIHVINSKPEYDSILIFTSARKLVSEIVKAMKKAGFQSKGISSDLEQTEREEVLRLYRAKRIRVLVATDVLSRGIDIKEINMVINFDCPHDAEDYVHRIGRTARANTKGEAVTLVNEKDMIKFGKIERLIEMEVPRLALPEELGEGPVYVARGGANKTGNSGGKKKFFKKKPKA